MNRLKVLYVEDEDDIRLIAKASMESIGGFEVKDCASGQEALDAAPGFDPEIIVLDVMMPGMTGPETLARLRQIETVAETPFIFMTAKVQSDEIGEYMKLGAAGVIAKPFDVMTLPEQIWSYCRTGRK